MIYTANRIPVNPDHATAFEERFKHRASLVDAMPGFVSNQVLRPLTEGAPYIVLTQWESMEHFRAWVDSPAFKQGHARSGSLPADAFTGRSQLEIHEVVGE